MSKDGLKLGYYPGSHVKNNVFSFLDKHIEKDPNHLALMWATQEKLLAWSGKTSDPLAHDSVTVGVFHEMITRTAGGYLEIGITKGDRVILFVPMSLPLYTAMFALQRIGAIPVFLDSWARRSQLGVSAQCVSPKAMVSFEKAFELCHDVPELMHVPIRVSVGPVSATSNIKYTASLEQLMQSPKPGAVAAVEQEETALITFTTGSSGTPKGANRTHRFLAAQHYSLNEGIPYLSKDIDLPVFPIFSLNNIAAGVTTVIPAIDVGTQNSTDASILLAQLNSCKVSCATLSPSLLNSLSAYCLKNSLTMPGLRRVVTGGAPVSRDNLVDFTAVAPKAETWVLFGSTEVEPMAHIEAKEMIGFKTRASVDDEWVDEGVNVGHIVENLEFRFLKIQKGTIEIQKKEDWADLEVPKGQVGELIVAGEHVCRDYYNNPEAFKRAKIRDERGVVWHRTGDLGRIDEKKYLWIVGRVHNAIQRGGQYVFPVRAEIILKKLKFVKVAAFLGMPDAKLGERTVAVIVPENAASLDSHQAEWKKETLRIMEKNGVPIDEIVFRSKIPLDPRHHSKVEYDILRQELLNERGKT